jgi:hypothetical protein
MKHIEITLPYQGTSTHPYLATIAMDPAHWINYEAAFADRPEVRQLGVDQSLADCWMVYTACASRAVRDLLESNW